MDKEKLIVKTTTRDWREKPLSSLTEEQRQQLAEDLWCEYFWWAKWFSPSEVKLLEKDDENPRYDSCLD